MFPHAALKALYVAIMIIDNLAVVPAARSSVTPPASAAATENKTSLPTTTRPPPSFPLQGPPTHSQPFRHLAWFGLVWVWSGLVWHGWKGMRLFLPFIRYLSYPSFRLLPILSRNNSATETKAICLFQFSSFQKNTPSYPIQRARVSPCRGAPSSSTRSQRFGLAWPPGLETKRGHPLNPNPGK